MTLLSASKARSPALAERGRENRNNIDHQQTPKTIPKCMELASIMLLTASKARSPALAARGRENRNNIDHHKTIETG